MRSTCWSRAVRVNRHGGTRSASALRPPKCSATMSTFRRRWDAQRRPSPRRARIISMLWATLLDGRQLSDRQIALFTTAFPHVVGVCVEVVQLVYKATDGGAVDRKGPLDRCLRDLGQHDDTEDTRPPSEWLRRSEPQSD